MLSDLGRKWVLRIKLLCWESQEERAGCREGHRTAFRSEEAQLWPNQPLSESWGPVAGELFASRLLFR